MYGYDDPHLHTSRHDVKNKDKLLEILNGIIGNFLHYELVEWAIYGAQWLDEETAVDFLLNVIQNNEHGTYRLSALDLLISFMQNESKVFDLVAKRIDIILKVANEDTEDIVRIRASGIHSIITNNQQEVYIPNALYILCNSYNERAKFSAFVQLESSNVSIKELKDNYNQVKIESDKFWFAFLLFLKGESEYEEILNYMIENKILTKFQIDFWNKHAKNSGLSKKIQIEDFISNINSQLETFESIVDKRPFNKDESEELLDLVKNLFDKRPSSKEINELKDKFDELTKVNCKGLKGKELGKCRDRKGELLENFMELFLSKSTGLIIRDRNRNFKNEELDLIVENNIWEPFFNNLNSPLIFIECKNWDAKVPTAEIGNFANKIRKRKGSVKLGIFVAINGLTKGYEDEIKDLIRDGYIIVIIEGKDFIEFFSNPSIGIIEFIKSKIVESLM